MREGKSVEAMMEQMRAQREQERRTELKEIMETYESMSDQKLLIELVKRGREKVGALNDEFEMMNESDRVHLNPDDFEDDPEFQERIQGMLQEKDRVSDHEEAIQFVLKDRNISI